MQSHSPAKEALKDQPNHIKEYKLSKIFGERVGVEKVSLLDSEGMLFLFKLLE